MEETRTLSVAITDNIATCDAIDNRKAKQLSVLLPASTTQVTYYGCATSGGTYKVIGNAGTAGVAGSLTADTWHTLPIETYCFPFLKLLGNATGGATTAMVKRDND